MISIARQVMEVFLVRLTSGLRSSGRGGLSGGGGGGGAGAGLGAPAELEARGLGGAGGRGGGCGGGSLGGGGLRGGGGRGGHVLRGGQQLGGAHVIALCAGVFVLRRGGDLVLEVLPGEDGVQFQRHLVHGGHRRELSRLPVLVGGDRVRSGLGQGLAVIGQALRLRFLRGLLVPDPQVSCIG